MSVTIRQVVQAFEEKKILRTDNLESTGACLLSYSWWEMACWVKDVRDDTLKIMVRSGERYSVSTARQFSRGELWQYDPSPEVTPRSSRYMKLPEWAERRTTL